MKTLEILHRLLEPDEKILYYSDEGKIVQVNTWGDNPRGADGRPELGGGRGQPLAITDRRMFIGTGFSFGKTVILTMEAIYNPINLATENWFSVA